MKEAVARSYSVQVELIPASAIEPNDWNPNRMTPFIRDKTIESIRTYGFIDPLTVWPDPDSGRYVIIDGEHRFDIGVDDFGMDLFPSMVVEGLSRDDAKKLTVALNELHGQADPAKLGELLGDLLTDMDMDELLVGLPFTAEIVSSLLDGGAVSLPDLPAPTPKSSEAAWVERLFRFPPDVAQVIDGALARARARAELEDDESIVDWQALERICADYLAS
jgi:ParB-like chromosome segregation protein Spo0J